DHFSYEENGFQTERITTSDAAAATVAVSSSDQLQQTDEIQTADEEVQSYLVEHLDAETEMESIDTKNIRLQTMNTVILEMGIQSEDLGCEEERKSPSKMASAKRRLKKAFGKKEMKRRNSAGDLEIKDDQTESVTGSDGALIDTEDEVKGEENGDEEDEENGSEESLHWDPVDGMHAEKQLPVKKLTAMFESPKMIERKNTTKEDPRKRRGSRNDDDKRRGSEDRRRGSRHEEEKKKNSY
ncbi:hypothetical protein PFISCL1PPCAC_15405, partial [Pristionchus fissidentatus]